MPPTFPFATAAPDREPRILTSVLHAMGRHALDDAPLECCGMLTGRDGLIERISPLINQSASPTRFSVAPEDLFHFFRSIRETSRQWLGIYHSHPASAAIPSKRDSENFHYPGVSYWIVSPRVKPPDIRCFKWVRIGFIETKYRIFND